MHPRPVASLGAELQQNLELLHRLFVEVDAGQGNIREHESVRRLLARLRRQPHLHALPKIPLRVYAELAEALNGVRLTRETIQAYSVERLRDTHARLTEVSAATETAAMEMLNGLDRSLALVEALERGGESGVLASCDALRAEVNQAYGALQFQDISTQQLRAVAALLVEVEQRLETVASLFDEGTTTGAAPAASAPAGVPDPATYNAAASMRSAPERQTLIDEAFSAARANTPPVRGARALHMPPSRGSAGGRALPRLEARSPERAAGRPSRVPGALAAGG